MEKVVFVPVMELATQSPVIALALDFTLEIFAKCSDVVGFWTKAWIATGMVSATSAVVSALLVGGSLQASLVPTAVGIRCAPYLVGSMGSA